MQTATKGDPPDWFTQPTTIVTASICRLSGRLAGEGCRDAVITDRDGNLTRGSLEYTEFFVRGTEPTDYCPIHGKVHGQVAAGTPAEGDRPGAPAVVPIHPSTPVTFGAQQPPTVTIVESSTKPGEPEPAKQPEKKKGFWAKIFGKKD